MRALALLLVAVSSCSVVVDTDNLSGGTRQGADSAVGNDTSTPDSSTCNPEDCLDDALVVPLADIAPCSAEPADRFACRQKVAETCRTKDPCCYRGGYGPVAFPNATEATILCLTEPTYDAPLSEILSSGSGCTAGALGSRACDNAVHISATKRGKGTGILQKAPADTATVLGLEFADEASVTWSELTRLDSACTMANAEKQACTNAVQRYCTTGDFDGYVGGVGPLSWTSSDVTVVCF